MQISKKAFGLYLLLAVPTSLALVIMLMEVGCLIAVVANFALLYILFFMGGGDDVQE